ncbi:MAG: hypothetical protein P8X75_14425 [Limibacillus sp.]|jgi:hypothetical protein
MNRRTRPCETVKADCPTNSVWDDYEAALEAYAVAPTPETAARLEGLAQIYRRRLAVEAWRAPGLRGYPWTGERAKAR